MPVKAINGVQSTGLAAVGTLAFQASVTGDTQNRLTVAANGVISWGPGNAVVDTTLQRLAAGNLNMPSGMSTGAALSTQGNTAGTGAGTYQGPGGTLASIRSAYGNSFTAAMVGDTGTYRFNVDSNGKIWWGDGTIGTSGSPSGDTTLYRGAPDQLTTDDEFRISRTAGLNALTILVPGDGQTRFKMFPSGQMFWGDGTLAPDTTLYRSNINVLRTDGSMVAIGGFNAAGMATAGAAAWQSSVTGDTQIRFTVDAAGTMRWGPGGSTALDTFTNLYRVTTSVLGTSGALRVYGASNADRYWAIGDNVIAVQGSASVATQVVTLSGNLGPSSSPVLTLGGDTNLYRFTADVLKTDDAFTAVGTLSYNPATAAGTAFRSLIAAEANTRFSITWDGGLLWGAGGATAVDTNLYRPSGVANTLRTDDEFQALGNITANLSGAGQIALKTDGISFGSAGDVKVSRAATGVILVNAAIATLSYGTSLPSSPVDGQEFTLVDSLTNPFWQWRFRYNAGNSTAYKWEFIGGAPLVANTFVGNETLTAVSTWSTPPTLTDIVVPRTGVYTSEHGVTFYAGAGACAMQGGIADATVSNTPITADSRVYIAAGGQPATIGAKYPVTVTVSHVLRFVYNQTAANGLISQRFIGITPIRVT